MNFRSVLLVALLTGFIASGSAQTGPKKPAPPAAKPAAKPTAQDPATALMERSRATIKSALEEMRLLRIQYKAEVVGKPYGRFLPAPPGPDGVDMNLGIFESKVPAEYGEKGYPEQSAEKSLAQIDLELAQWKQQKLDTKSFVSHLFSYVIEAIGNAYALSKPVYEVKVLTADLAHTMDIRRQTLSRQAASAGVGKSRNEQQRLMQKMLEDLDAAKIDLWGDAVARTVDLRKRVDRARKRWGAELWRYFEFAEAKTATASDGFAVGKGKVQDALQETFASRTRPIDFNSSLNNGLYVDVSSSLSMKEAGGTSGPFDHFVNPTEPQIQVFRNATAYLSTDLCLEPPVEKLRNYVEPPEPPAITDTILLPPLNSGGTPIKGRVLATMVEGSAAYTLFAYGPKLPARRSQIRLEGPGRGILYEAIATSEDLKSGSADLKRQFEVAQNILGRGLNSAQQQDLRNLPFVVLRARLTPNVLPGRHTFKINGAPTGWFLDKGTGRAEIVFVREVVKDPDSDIEPANRFEATTSAYVGESVRIQVKTAIPTDLKEIPVVLGKGGVWVDLDLEPTLLAKAAEGEPGVYRTGPILLVEPDDPRLHRDNPNAGREPGVKYVDPAGGQGLQARLEDERLFEMASPVTSLKAIPEPPLSLWYDALSRAAKSAGVYSEVMNWNTLPGKTAQEITNHMYSQLIFRAHLQWLVPFARAMQWYHGYSESSTSRGDVIFTNAIKLGDHAAMLLLRDRFVLKLGEVSRELEKLENPDAQIAFLDSLGPYMEELPMGRIVCHGQAAVPDRFKNRISAIALTETLRSYYAGPQTWAREERDYPGWIRAAKLMAFAKYRQSVSAALEKARDIPDSDIEALLALIGTRPPAAQAANARVVGSGFDEVAKEVRDLLMKPVKSGAGYRWVPDQVARGSVMGLNAALEAIRAQREYSAIDTQFDLAVASIVPIILPAGIARTVISIALAALSAADFYVNTFREFDLREQEFSFALGASEVLGAERYYLADVQRTPTWSLGLQVLGAGLGVLTSAPEVLSLMGKLTKRVAFPLARALAGKIKQLGVAAYYKALPDEQAALLLANAQGDLRAAEQGAQALSPGDLEIQAAVRAVAEDVAKKPLPRSIRAPELEIVNPQQFAAPPEVKIDRALIPSSPGAWEGPGGAPILMDKRLDNGFTTNFVVFREAGKKVVVKICKELGRNSRLIMSGVKKAVDTVRLKKIKHLAIEGEVVVAEERAMLRQSLLTGVTAEGQEMATCDKILKDMVLGASSKTVAASMAKSSLLQFARYARSLTGISKRWTEFEDSIVALLKDLKNKAVAFEDFKLDNIFAERSAARKLEVGICDIDRIEPWNDFSEGMQLLARYIVDGSVYSKIRSVRGIKGFRGDATRMLFSLNEYQIMMLEAKQMIVYNPSTKMFQDGILSVKKLAAIYPELNQPFFVDFVERAKTLVRPPEPALWLRILSTLRLPAHSFPADRPLAAA